jgi:hypothetical protein
MSESNSSELVDARDQFSVKRFVTVRWADGEAPAVSEDRHSGFADNARLVYEWDFDANAWRGNVRFDWRWTLKSGALGEVAHASWRTPNWLRELKDKYMPRTTLSIVEVEA